MGFFSRKKKNQIKTPFGYISEFTTESELPNDLPTLRAMGYYYAHRVKNREYAYYIDKKIISLDSKKEYLDARKRMAHYYFDGFMVPKDNAEGSRYFIEWMDACMLSDMNLSSMIQIIRDYFYYGFRSYSYLLDMARRRIELDIKNDAEPVGMCIYQSVLELWQYSKLVDILEIGPANATVYFKYLKENFDAPNAEFMWDLVLGETNTGKYYKDDESYLKMEALASKGNILALRYMLDKWLYIYYDNKDQTKLADNQRYQAEYERMIVEYKKLQHTYDHSKNLALKEQTDELLLKYADFFKGTCTKLPADYPFSKKPTSLYYHVEKFVNDYNELYALWPNRGVNYAKMRSLQENLEKSVKFFVEKDYAFGMYQALLCKTNVGVWFGAGMSVERIYEKLVNKGYGPALRLGTEVTEETRELVLELRLNRELIKEEADRLYDLAVDQANALEWQSAIINLSKALKYGKEIPHYQKQRIVKNAVTEAHDAYKRKDGSKDISDICYVYSIAADHFKEPAACFWYAIVLNNDKGYYDDALKYGKLALEYKDHSYVYGGATSEEFVKKAEENIRTIEVNML